jgi:hypothetical protein
MCYRVVEYPQAVVEVMGAKLGRWWSKLTRVELIVILGVEHGRWMILHSEQVQTAEKDLQRKKEKEKKIVENLDMTQPRIERDSCFTSRCQIETAQVRALCYRVV